MSTLTIPMPTTNRFGEFIPHDLWTADGLRYMKVWTRSGNQYVWFPVDGGWAFGQCNHSSRVINHPTVPVWVHHDGGRALLVEDSRDAAVFVRTSRITKAVFMYRDWLGGLVGGTYNDPDLGEG